MEQTAHYAASLQNPDGGFAGQPGGKSTLGGTSSAIRILKYNGGSIPDVLGAIDYVKSCFDPETGGFAPEPGGKPDAHTTSIGLMAASELKVADAEMVRKAVNYLAEHAEGFPEVRLAVAGLEAVKAPCPVEEKWLHIINEGRNDDGTWGSGEARAFETGGHAVALLRLGRKLEHQDTILEAMRAGQNPDGGWSEKGDESDLSATYRVMRGFFMMDEKADFDRLRSLLAKCRQPDGSYSVKPGEKSGAGTYYASIVQMWIRMLEGEPAFREVAGFRPLFDGKSLDGWQGDKSNWKVENGMLVGDSPGLDHNEFLVAPGGNYENFTLRFSFRLKDGKGNSGVQFRSERVPGTEMSGYQADIGEKYWGSLYDESRRRKTLAQASERALNAVRKDGWNHYVVRAMGPHITMTLNGVTSVNYTENDPDIARSGKIAVQIHGGGPMRIEFKDMDIQVLPSPSPDDSATPGFHLRTVKSGGEDRKYSVFLPNGYDGEKTFPVVLFLHGSGERGDDGVRSAQVGLGAIIAGRPEDFPFIAVFPQARQTWAADSADAEAALAALDDVLSTYKADRDHVVLTGLSMGGAGSWQMAAKHPDRFVAVAPVCGFGTEETARKVAESSLPVWTFVGDADSDSDSRQHARPGADPQEGRRQRPSHGVPGRRTQFLGPGLFGQRIAGLDAEPVIPTPAVAGAEEDAIGEAGPATRPLASFSDSPQRQRASANTLSFPSFWTIPHFPQSA